MVYISEAHAIDGERPSRTVKIMQHTNFEERQVAAEGCVKDLGLTMPVLVDDMENTVADAYRGKPDRLFILGSDGKVAYSGEKGPHGFHVDEMVERLEALLKE